MGCWHCKDTDHTRSGGRDGKGKKCPEFAELLKKANPGIVDVLLLMKLPTSYMGAHEKALIAAGGKPRRLNMLDDADISDSESDFEEPITPGRHGSIRMLTSQTPLVTTIDEPPTPVTIGAQHLCRPVPSTSTRNAFQALAEDHHELDDETIAALTGWATVSYRKPGRGTKTIPAPRSPDVLHQFTMRSEQDLDVLLRAHPH